MKKDRREQDTKPKRAVIRISPEAKEHLDGGAVEASHQRGYLVNVAELASEIIEDAFNEGRVRYDRRSDHDESTGD